MIVEMAASTKLETVGLVSSVRACDRELNADQPLFMDRKTFREWGSGGAENPSACVEQPRSERPIV